MIQSTRSAGRLLRRESRQTGSRFTQRVYDAVAPFYGISARLFHSRAHGAALAACSIQNGMRILELGMGSGEMFARLLDANRDGQIFGIDLSPKMAARSQAVARRLFPDVLAQCQAADACRLPFPSGSLDAVVCCYLFELLDDEDIHRTLDEIRRVLKPHGRLTLTLVGEKKRGFSAAYRVASKVAPAFWGRQVDQYVVSTLPSCGFRVTKNCYVRQLFYVSRVISAVSINADSPSVLFCEAGSISA